MTPAFDIAPWTEMPIGPEFAFMLRTSRADGTSRNHFDWPTSGYVACGNEEEGHQRDGIRNWSGALRAGLYGFFNGRGVLGLSPWMHGSEPPLWQIILVRRDEVQHQSHLMSCCVPRGWLVYSSADVFDVLLEGTVHLLKTGGDEHIFLWNSLFTYWAWVCRPSPDDWSLTDESLAKAETSYREILSFARNRVAIDEQKYCR